MAGWDDIEAISQTKTEVTEIDKLCVRVLNTEDGKKLLNWLRQQTIERPAWLPGLDSSNGFYQEGRSSVVRELETKIRRGLDG
jgi:hypothetical protein